MTQSKEKLKFNFHSDSLQNTNEDVEIENFATNLKTQVEIFVNRMKSNSSRGRSISNDSSVQNLFLNLTAMHSHLLDYIKKADDKRMWFEQLQDKLTQIKDSRAALDVLRQEHQEKLRQQAEEQERQRQMQMAYKLELMRKKKQEYLQYQRQLALQRIQEQEREMKLHQDQQKVMYSMGVQSPYTSPFMQAPGTPQQPRVLPNETSPAHMMPHTMNSYAAGPIGPMPPGTYAPHPNPQLDRYNPIPPASPQQQQQPQPQQQQQQMPGSLQHQLPSLQQHQQPIYSSIAGGQPMVTGMHAVPQPYPNPVGIPNAMPNMAPPNMGVPNQPFPLSQMPPMHNQHTQPEQPIQYAPRMFANTTIHQFGVWLFYWFASILCFLFKISKIEHQPIPPPTNQPPQPQPQPQLQPQPEQQHHQIAPVANVPAPVPVVEEKEPVQENKPIVPEAELISFDWTNQMI